MKKTAYIRPQVKTCMMEAESLMVDSGVTGDNGTGWGGTDEGGNKDPDANGTDMWDDNVWNCEQPGLFVSD